MWITAITHATARSKEEARFRGLAPPGTDECRAAAERHRELAAELDLPPIDAVVSSPKPRCLETAILFGKALGDRGIVATSVDLAPEISAGSVGGGEIVTLAACSDAEHVLVSGHADLAKALPGGAASCTPEFTDGGWFRVRPVLALVELPDPADRTSARLCAGEALVQGAWRDLLVR